MTRRQWVLLIVALGIALWMQCGCITPANRNMIAQVRHEAQQGIQKPTEATMRCQRIEMLTAAGQESYGYATRGINDDTLPSVISEVQSDFTLGKINMTGGSGLLVTLLGGGGIGGTLLLLLRQYLSERGKRKEIESGADDMVQAIEGIPNDVLKKEVKETVRKRQASRTAFGAIVKKATNT